jgi:hypothetical protein
VWRTGYSAGTGLLDASRPHDFELVAFADVAALQCLRKAESLHRHDVRLLIVTDGNRFESAWGDIPCTGSMLQWNWRQANEKAAYYFETRWNGPLADGAVERIRRKASCLWRWDPVAGRRNVVDRPPGMIFAAPALRD